MKAIVNFFKLIVYSIVCTGCGNTITHRAFRWANTIPVGWLEDWTFNAADGWRCPECSYKESPEAA